MTTVSQTIRDKAQRLLDNHQVERIDLSTYKIQGDTDLYSVTVWDANTMKGICQCRRFVDGHGVCSHLYAAAVQHLIDVGRSEWQQAYNAEKRRSADDPFEGL